MVRPIESGCPETEHGPKNHPKRMVQIGPERPGSDRGRSRAGFTGSPCRCGQEESGPGKIGHWVADGAC